MKKKLLFLTLVVCAFLMLGSVSVFAADDSSASVDASFEPSASGFFWDVEPREWYYNYIGFVGRHGIFQGYGEGEFRPQRNMTRAEVVRVLYTMEGEPEVTVTERFPDVPVNEWYAEEVEWAVSIGVIVGYPDGLFAPNAEISRQDFVAMLHRYAKYRTYDTAGRAELDFPDAADAGDYAKEDLAWAIDAGIISGSIESDGITYLRPTYQTTRAQVAKMLSVFAVEYQKLGATTDVTILAEDHTLTVGCSRLIQYAVAPYDTAYDVMTWTSSDESVVKVSRGILTGVSAGTAVVTATTFDGNSATCNVTVTEDPADPYVDVVDFVTLNYNYGQWNDFPGCMMGHSEEGWDFEYGVKLDVATSSISFYSKLIYPSDHYYYEVEFLTGRNSTEWIGVVKLIDEEYNETWRGEVMFDVSSVTPQTVLALTSYSCSEPDWADAETKAVMEETLTNELHWWATYMNDIFAEFGLKTTMEDIGFVNY